MDSKFYSDQSGREHFLVRVRDSKDGGLVRDISTKILGVTRPGQARTEDYWAPVLGRAESGGGQAGSVAQ